NVYTAYRRDTAWFASNPQLLRQAAGVPNVMSRDAIHGYLCCSYIPEPWTPYEHVGKLSAGMTFTYAPSRPEIDSQVTEYVRKETAPFLTDEADAVVTLRKHLRAVTARHLGGER